MSLKKARTPLARRGDCSIRSTSRANPEAVSSLPSRAAAISFASGPAFHRKKLKLDALL